MLHVVIDDERVWLNPDGSAPIILRTADIGVVWLAKRWTKQYLQGGHEVDELWLDHDLGDGGDIWPVVDFLKTVALADAPFHVRWINVHSQNPSGASQMVRALERHYAVRRSVLPEGVRTEGPKIDLM